MAASRIYSKLSSKVMGQTASNATDKTPYELLEGVEGIPGLKDEFRGTCRTLVLGPVGSGKTTIASQLQIAMNGGLSNVELKALKASTYRNVVEAALEVLAVADAQGLQFENLDADNVKLALDAFMALLSNDAELPMDSDILTSILQLQREATTSLILERHANLEDGVSLPLSTSYFLDNAARIGSLEYTPSIKDVLRLRLPHEEGPVETTLKIQSGRLIVAEYASTIRLAKDTVDWQKTGAILYCVPLDQYDSPSLRSLLRDFQKTVNSGWPSSTEVLVFLNMSDIFQQKLEKKPLRQYFTDYEGEDHDVKASAMHIWGKFKRRNQSGLSMHCFVTSAISTMDTGYIVRLMKNQIVATWLHRTELRAK